MELPTGFVELSEQRNSLHPVSFESIRLDLPRDLAIRDPCSLENTAGIGALVTIRRCEQDHPGGEFSGWNPKLGVGGVLPWSAQARQSKGTRHDGTNNQKPHDQVIHAASVPDRHAGEQGDCLVASQTPGNADRSGRIDAIAPDVLVGTQPNSAECLRLEADLFGRGLALAERLDGDRDRLRRGIE